MAANYVLLEKITVGAAGASSVEFSGIPQTGYTDLVVKASTRDTYAAAFLDMYMQMSGVTSSVYTYRRVLGNGTAASSATGTDVKLPIVVHNGSTSTASTFTNWEVYIPNYSSTSINKSISTDMVSEQNATLSYAALYSGIMANTSAVTSIKFLPETAFASGSTFYLYGVAKLGTAPAIAPKATGGDIIDTDGTYWYHIFRSSGTFTPAISLSCDYLVVAGGGGGGNASGGFPLTGVGGGGAGGYLTSIGGSQLSLSTIGYTVTVGAGGSGGSNGSNSVFSTFTATGGGKGADRSGTTGNSGGSGGGGAPYSGAGGAGTTGQGNNGGVAGGGTGNAGGGGGGGAGAVGTAGTSGGTGGAGGAGLANSISGTSVTYATGGKGGDGGSYAATAGAANTGNGGGGGTDNMGVSAAGGSGLVIVRYAV
jgi:hypothetical protein